MSASRRLTIDGWTALNAYVPPKERRGVVLVDPPFEDENDFPRLSLGLAAAHRKWATGIYALWYPIKGRREPDALAKRLRRLALAKFCGLNSLSILSVTRNGSTARADRRQPALDAGKRAFCLLPALAGILGREGKGGFRVDWIAGD